MTHAAETLAGTDPHDPASVLKIISTSVNSARMVTIIWSSVSGKSYPVALKGRITDTDYTFVSPLIVEDGRAFPAGRGNCPRTRPAFCE